MAVNLILMPDNVLYIIGNGFDLHHGVNSSYGAFRDWLERNNSLLFAIYSAICDYDALWSDFEASMAYVDRDYFISAAELFLPDYSKDPDDWSMADIVMAGDVAREQAEELLNDLKTSFHRWVKTLRAPRDYSKRKVMIDYDARFLTFNYTDFLETEYGIPSAQINHIHGHKLAKKGSIVVGHAEDTNDLFDKWWNAKQYNKPHYNKKGKKYFKRDAAYKTYRSELPEFEGIAQGAEEYFEESRKPVSTIIASNKAYFNDLYDIETIYVFGFSFNKVDMPYIQEIISVNDSPERIKWHVSYYSESEVEKFSLALSTLGVDVATNVEFKPLTAWQMR